MNGNYNTMTETPRSEESRRRANPSYYLDRVSATILMLMKLIEGLAKLCLAILGAFALQTIVSVLNRIFQQGTAVDDVKAMVAQSLKTLQIPMATIKQIVDSIPSDIRFSYMPIVYLFVAFLPFVLIAVLEAIAAIRLRFGKGGTRTLGILQTIRFVLGAIKLIVFALLGIGLSIFTLIRLGGPLAIMLSTVYISLTGFFVLTGLPGVLYHRYIAKLMKDIRYELVTGMQSVRRRTRFQQILTILIVLEVIGVAVSLIASWRPQQGINVMLIASLVGLAVTLLKYICVMICHRNFMLEDFAVGTERNVSHVPQIILIVVVTLIFVIPTAFLCVQSNVFSKAVAEKVDEYFQQARQTVDEVSAVAEQQIEAAQTAIADQAEALQPIIDPLIGQVAGTAATQASQDGAKEGTAGSAASTQTGSKETGATEGAQNGAKEGTAGSAAFAQTGPKGTGATQAPQNGTKEGTAGPAASTQSSN